MAKPDGTIRISAKCSDLLSAIWIPKDPKAVTSEYCGYVPEFFPGDHYGDYVILDIDARTGKIKNWKPPTEQDLQNTFGKI